MNNDATRTAAGGEGGGGTGRGGSTAATPGSSNTGGGAGGTGQGGAAGGSGIVIIRYPDTFDDLTTIGGTLVHTKNTTGGYKIYSFTSGTGTVTV